MNLEVTNSAVLIIKIGCSKEEHTLPAVLDTWLTHDCIRSIRGARRTFHSAYLQESTTSSSIHSVSGNSPLVSWLLFGWVRLCLSQSRSWSCVKQSLRAIGSWKRCHLQQGVCRAQNKVSLQVCIPGDGLIWRALYMWWFSGTIFLSLLKLNWRGVNYPKHCELWCDAFLQVCRVEGAKCSSCAQNAVMSKSMVKLSRSVPRFLVGTTSFKIIFDNNKVGGIARAPVWGANPFLQIIAEVATTNSNNNNMIKRTRAHHICTHFTFTLYYLYELWLNVHQGNQIIKFMLWTRTMKGTQRTRRVHSATRHLGISRLRGRNP